MKTNYITIAAILLSSLFIKETSAQPYVDLIKVQVKNFSPVAYDSLDGKMATQQYQGNLFLPIELKSKDLIVAGGSFNQYDINFQGDASAQKKITAVALNIGYIKKWQDEKYSLLMIALPKISSDFETINSKHYQMGGVVLLSVKKSDKLKLKAGLYYNREFFGNQWTPLLGFAWKANDRLNIWGTLPNAMTVEYKLLNKLYIGYRYKSTVATFRLSENNGNSYVRDGHLSFGNMRHKAFIEVSPSKNIVLFTEVGHTFTRKMERYQNGKVNADTPLSNDKLFMAADDGMFVNVGMAFRVSLDKK